MLDALKRNGGKILVAVPALALLVAIVAYAFPRNPPPPEPVVPDVVGSELEAAQDAIVREGLVPIVELVETDDYVEREVIDQSPSAGATVEDGSTVRLEVAQAPRETTTVVQNYINDGFEQASNSAEDAGLAVDLIFEETDVGRPDLVFRQDPVQGTEVELGSTVTLWVATAPPGQVVPVRGSALSAFQDLDAEVVIEAYRPDLTLAEGTVISSSPDGGSDLADGGRVTVIISTGTASGTYRALSASDRFIVGFVEDLTFGSVLSYLDGNRSRYLELRDRLLGGQFELVYQEGCAFSISTLSATDVISCLDELQQRGYPVVAIDNQMTFGGDDFGYHMVDAPFSEGSVMLIFFDRAFLSEFQANFELID